MLSDQIQVGFETMPGVIGQVQSGTLRALGVSSDKPLPFLPGVPTVAESGVPGFTLVSWNGFVMPAKTPRDIVLRLNKEIAKALEAPEIREAVLGLGMTPRTSTPEELQRIYEADVARWRRSSPMLRSASNDVSRASRRGGLMNTVPRIKPAAAQPAGADRIDPLEWETRVDLAACYRLVDLFGMSDLHLNHISARVPGQEEHFLINPFGMMYEEITASSLIKIDLEGNIIANANPDYSINLPGYVIHSAIHGARHDVACVLHTHTNAGMAVSALKCGLLPLTQTAMRWSRIAYHDFEGVVVDLDEQKRLAENLGDSEVMILRNHGLLAVGKTIGQAFNNIYRLERACQTQLLAMACNAEISLPPQEVIARSNAQLAVLPSPDAKGRKRPHGSMEWPALKRMLDRRDPSYKN